MDPTTEPAGGPGLMQMLAQMQGGASPQGMPPGPPEPAEGEGGSPLIQMLLAILMGQGGGQGGMPSMPPAIAGGGMPMGGGGEGC